MELVLVPIHYFAVLVHHPEAVARQVLEASAAYRAESEAACDMATAVCVYIEAAYPQFQVFTTTR